MIKTKSIRKNVEVNKTDNVKIKTLAGQTKSVGTCNGTFLLDSNFECEFHVIDENININVDGILGNNFLSQHCNVEGPMKRLMFPRTETNNESFFVPFRMTEEEHVMKQNNQRSSHAIEVGVLQNSDNYSSHSHLQLIKSPSRELVDSDKSQETKALQEDIIEHIRQGSSQPTYVGALQNNINISLSNRLNVINALRMGLITCRVTWTSTFFRGDIVKQNNRNNGSHPQTGTLLPNNVNNSSGKCLQAIKSFEFGMINAKIPPRSKIFLNIKTNIEKEMICLAEEVENGVYLGNCLVKPRNNQIVVSFLNINNYPVEIKNFRPKIEFLEKFDIINLNSEETVNSKNNRSSNTKQVFYTKQDSSNNENLHGRLKTIRKMVSIDKNLNIEEEQSLNNLLKEYGDIFYLPGDTLSHTFSIQHEIPVSNDQGPINQKPYRLPQQHKDVIDAQVDKMLEEGIIEMSKSPWNSPLLVVPKKPGPDGQKRWRVVVDYRKLNKITTGDAFPLPRIEDILDQLGHSRYFSTLDLASGYHQIEIAQKDREKTAFSTPYGHYHFKRMPFGLKGAPATFQRLMNYVLTGLQGIKCFVYLDDVVIYGRNLLDHQTKLREVFQKLREHNLKLQPEKCSFLKKEIIYLGHKCSSQGVSPDFNLVKCVQEFPTPKNVKQLQSFLGLGNYYRKFVPNFAQIVAPLNRLLRKNVKFVWHDEHKTAFENLKKSLINPPVLIYPDFSQPFHLTTDASNDALGAVLSQGEIGNDKPIAFASRSLNDAERKYSTIEKELLAVVWAVKNFRCYLYGRPFIVYSDHKPLKGAVNIKDTTSRILRLRHKLSEYDYKIEYRAGKYNTNADALSRIPNTSVQCLVLTRAQAKNQERNVQKKGSNKSTLQEIQNIDNNKNSREEINSLDSLSEPDSNIDILTNPEEIKTILRDYHDLPLGGHQGFYKTYQRIKRNFRWKGMLCDIKNYIKKCKLCQKNKQGRTFKMPMMITDTPRKPFDKTYMDIVGPLEETNQGNKYILTFEDDLTKFMDAIAIPDMEAKTVAKVFVDEIICRYRIPKILVTDQGSNFTSDMFKQVCKFLKIKKVQTTPYHPQSNGSLERSHKSLMEYLRSFNEEYPYTWDDHLRAAMFVRNNSVHTSTKLTPNDCLYGFTARIPNNLKRDPPPIYNDENYFFHIRDKILRAHKIARENLKRSKEISKQHYDKKVFTTQFQVGDEVLLLNHAKRNKFSPRWIGPYRVIEINSAVNTTILRGKSKRRVHNNNLKPYQKSL